MACGDNSNHRFGTNIDTGFDSTSSYYVVPTPCKMTFYHPYHVSLMDINYDVKFDELVLSDNISIQNMHTWYTLYTALK